MAADAEIDAAQAAYTAFVDFVVAHKGEWTGTAETAIDLANKAVLLLSLAMVAAMGVPKDHPAVLNLARLAA
jgi:hypothetical protein